MQQAYEFKNVHKIFKASKESFELLSSNQLGKKSIDEAIDNFQSLCSVYGWLETNYPETEEINAAKELIFEGRRLLYGNKEKSDLSDELSLIEKIQQSYSYIKTYTSIAAAIALTSAALAALLVLVNPNFGWNFINEETAVSLKSGTLWTDSIEGVNSITSSKIATNNIKVSLLAFATGITGGVLTVLILISNGALLGGIFATLSHYDMAHRLLEFILAHGFLELSIIAIAAGAGLFIGDGLIKPGKHRRLKAAQIRFKKTIPIILFSCFCLLPCGFVEGFVSPSPAIPIVAKLGVGVSIAFVYWRLILGGGFNKGVR